jgi:hypothetical protein
MTEEIVRFAIVAGEHCCFGNFKEFCPECEMCDVCRDCEYYSEG